ncbi:MAG: hypothetical protein IIV18_02980 [Lachnospiraceae bacterium]|nr:hypothetical protein [Lachnospiraceae bacterium]
MSLQLIIGGSGSGKSYRIYQNIIRESMENPDRNYLVLVPEQFTMQTQKDLVRLHPNHGILNIDVLSFQRLAYHVFDEVGGGHRKVLEDTGKNLVLRRLAQLNKDKMKVLGSKLERMGYISEMKSVLSELAQYNVDGTLLDKAAELVADNRLLQDKLHDIGLLQEEFRKYREGAYITSEEILEELCRVAERSEKIKDTVIALDGFTGFTPIQYLLLDRLLKCAKKVMVTVTLDSEEYPFTSVREEELFALSKNTIWELRHIAAENGIEEEEPILLSGENPRFGQNEELVFLEKHLLRYDNASYTEDPKNIRLYRWADPEQEVIGTAREILRLIREGGYRYRDIAVVTGDMGSYCNYVQRHFDDCGIPCFIDYKRDILANPFVEFLRAVFQMMEENFSYDSVFRYLKSGLTGISTDVVDRMDNYCVAMGLRGY